MKTSLPLLFVLLLSPFDAGAAAADSFRELAGLVGVWDGKSASGKPLRIAYRLISNGSALIETWDQGPGRETMTVYHLDGDRLVADHYCAQGNVPRLELDGPGKAGRFAFRFRDGTNLQLRGKAHQHAFWLDTSTPDRLGIGSVYVENHATPDEIRQAKADQPLVLTRVATGTPDTVR